MGVSPEDLTIRAFLGLDVSKFSDGLNKAAKHADTFNSKLKSIGDTLSSAGKKLTLWGGVIAGGIFAAVKSAANLGDELNSMSEKTGYSVETLSKLKYTVEQNEGSFEDLNTGLKFFSRSIVEASESQADTAKKAAQVNSAIAELDIKYRSGKISIDKYREAKGNLIEKLIATSEEATGAAEAYKTLGININDASWKTKSNEDRLFAVAEAFKNVTDVNQQTTISMALFGKSGTNLIPMLKLGAGGLREYYTEAERLGVVISTEAAQRADQFNDALNRLKFVVQGLTIQIADKLIPAIEPFINKLVNEIIPKVSAWIKENEGLVTGLLKFGLVVGGLMVVLGPPLFVLGQIIMVISSLSGMITVILGIVGTIVGAISLPVVAIIAAIAAVVVGGVLLYKNWDVVKAKAIEVWGFLIDLFQRAPEIIGTALGTIAKTVIYAVTHPVETIKNIISTTWEWIQSTFNYIYNFTAGIMDRLTTFIGEKIYAMLQWLDRLRQAFLRAFSASWYVDGMRIMRDVTKVNIDAASLTFKKGVENINSSMQGLRMLSPAWGGTPAIAGAPSLSVAHAVNIDVEANLSPFMRRVLNPDDIKRIIEQYMQGNLRKLTTSGGGGQGIGIS